MRALGAGLRIIKHGRARRPIAAGTHQRCGAASSGTPEHASAWQCGRLPVGHWRSEGAAHLGPGPGCSLDSGRREAKAVRLGCPSGPQFVLWLTKLSENNHKLGLCQRRKGICLADVCRLAHWHRSPCWRRSDHECVQAQREQGQRGAPGHLRVQGGCPRSAEP